MKNDFNLWLKYYRKVLEQTQIPSEIYESKKRWNYFLDHDCDSESNWSIDSLSEVERKKINEVLKKIKEEKV